MGTLAKEETGGGTVDAFDLTGRRVLVTGAAGGIGAAIARLAADSGADVVATDVAPAEQMRDRIGRGAVATARLDTGDRDAVGALLAQSGPFWGLVDAAGLCLYVDWEDDGFEEALERTLHVNLRGPINLGRAALPMMTRSGGGRIVFIGSVAGWMGGIRSGPHYAFTKGGLHAYTRWLAQKAAGSGILVNAIAPGPIETAMTAGQGYDPDALPLGRFGRPEEIAAAALFLLGPGGGYTTGAVIDVNGGTHFR